MLKGYKTVLIMGAALVLAVLDFVEPSMLSDALGVGEQGRAIIAIAVPVLALILRKLTTSPLGKKI